MNILRLIIIKIFILMSIHAQARQECRKDLCLSDIVEVTEGPYQGCVGEIVGHKWRWMTVIYKLSFLNCRNWPDFIKRVKLKPFLLEGQRVTGDSILTRRPVASDLYVYPLDHEVMCYTRRIKLLFRPREGRLNNPPKVACKK